MNDKTKTDDAVEQADTIAAPVERLVITKLNKMSDAPRNGVTVLAYHLHSKRFHPVFWCETARRTYWSNSWARDYSQQDGEYKGWIPYPVYEL